MQHIPDKAKKQHTAIRKYNTNINPENLTFTRFSWHSTQATFRRFCTFLPL